MPPHDLAHTETALSTTHETTPALRLLLALLRRNLEAESHPIDSPLLDGVDWQNLVWLATERHRVVPQLARAIAGEAGRVVPGEIAAQIHAAQGDIVRHCLVLSAELASIAGALNREGIPFLCLKGPALSVQLHGDPAARHYRDIDLIVPPEHLLRTEEVIRERGFKPKDASVPLVHHHLRQTSAVDLGYFNPTHNTFIELHWCPLRPRGLLGMEFAELHARSVAVNIGGQKVCAPHIEHTLQFLCAHGAKHAWFRLKWLCDVATMVHADRVAWDDALRVARQIGTERMLRQGLALCEDFLGVPSPLPAPPSTQRRRIASLVAFGRTALTDQREPSCKRLRDRIRRTRYHAALRGDLRYRWATFSRRLRIQVSDIATVNLPPWLMPLHYLLRPFFVIHRLVTGRGGKAT